MLAALITNLQLTATRTAHTAVLGAGGCVALLIGLGFWTLAGWLFLSSVTTSLNAAIIIGAIYTGLGLMTFVAISIRSRRIRRMRALRAQTVAAHATKTELGTLAAAFMGGFSAGSRGRL